MSIRLRSTFVSAAVAAAVIVPTAPTALAADAPSGATAQTLGKLNISCEGDVDFTVNPGLTFLNQGAKRFKGSATFDCSAPGHPEITRATADFSNQEVVGGCPLGGLANMKNVTVKWNNGRTTSIDEKFKLTPTSMIQVGQGTATEGLFKGGTVTLSGEVTSLPVVDCVLPGGVTHGTVRKRFSISGGQDDANLCATKVANGAQRGLAADSTGRRETRSDC
jgi:hypothetical protein